MAAMAGRSQLNGALSFVEGQYKDAIQNVIVQSQGIIANASDRDGNLDRESTTQAITQIGDLLEVFMAGGNREPYADDGVTANSDMAQILNLGYVKAVYDQVTVHEQWMQKRIPNDVFQYLQNANRQLEFQEMTAYHWYQIHKEFDRWHDLAHDGVNIFENDNPFLKRDDETDEEYRERIDAAKLFHPNPLAQIDDTRQWVPMQKWQDSRGYQLSDRIWNNTLEVRQSINRLISQALAEGWSAIRLAKQLEQYVLPGGKTAYYAMRLARSEIARAANQAAYLSSYLNPYIDAVDIVRSSTGDNRCPICPIYASLGIGGGRNRPPYPLDAAPIPIFHPYCKCHTRGVVTDNPRVVTQRIRAIMQSGGSVTPSVNPASKQSLLSQMLGNQMINLLAQVA